MPYSNKVEPGRKVLEKVKLDGNAPPILVSCHFGYDKEESKDCQK